MRRGGGGGTKRSSGAPKGYTGAPKKGAINFLIFLDIQFLWGAKKNQGGGWRQMVTLRYHLAANWNFLAPHKIYCL